MLATIARRRGTGNETVEQAVRRCEARRLAIAIRDADRDLTANEKQLRHIVSKLAPDLLARRGIGPVSAASAIIAWSHPGRCRNNAAFAALAGASPVLASSGRVVRHRLNRGGDRQLNKALHTTASTRWRDCPRTAAYIQLRQAEGKADGEIRRMLKRLHRPRNLPRAQQGTHRRLTNIEASKTRPDCSGAASRSAASRLALNLARKLVPTHATGARFNASDAQ
jgi:hypothetical protein